MATITFDTHLAVKQLTESGFDEKQAEAMVTTFSKAVHQGDRATKRDVTEVKAEIKADMRQMKAELEMSVLRMALITIGATTALVSVIMGIMFQVMQ